MASKCLANPTSGPWSKPTDMLCCWNASDILRLSWLNLWWDCCTAPQWFPFAAKILAGPSMVLSIWARSLFANWPAPASDMPPELKLEMILKGSTVKVQHHFVGTATADSAWFHSWITKIYKRFTKIAWWSRHPNCDWYHCGTEHLFLMTRSSRPRSGGRSPFIPTKVIHQHSVQSRGDAWRIDVNTQRLKYLDTWYHEIPWNNTGGLALLETGTNTWWLAKKVTKHGKHCLEYSGYVRCCDIRFFNAYLGKLCIYIKWETKQIIPTGLKDFSEPVPTSGWNLETMHRFVRTLC